MSQVAYGVADRLIGGDAEEHARIKEKILAVLSEAKGSLHPDSMELLHLRHLVVRGLHHGGWISLLDMNKKIESLPRVPLEEAMGRGSNAAEVMDSLRTVKEELNSLIVDGHIPELQIELASRAATVRTLHGLGLVSAADLRKKLRDLLAHANECSLPNHAAFGARLSAEPQSYLWDLRPMPDPEWCFILHSSQSARQLVDSLSAYKQSGRPASEILLARGETVERLYELEGSQRDSGRREEMYSKLIVEALHLEDQTYRTVVSRELGLPRFPTVLSMCTNAQQVADALAVEKQRIGPDDVEQTRQARKKAVHRLGDLGLFTPEEISAKLADLDRGS
eukprot:CAMPEP_0170732944 /NCGR_PEP_ID=MMETSP0437-20130122/1818_1 /TAXON_ID=0 /ORGANISM="Sexangularia sp." /LENGTH=336 /DNA_ID=CAMNT_0011071207 /DNA_START=211 /DNA_END=1222 /DNA_ORIENTATION=+